jgi:ABC-type multidrug transport system permease subunit
MATLTAHVGRRAGGHGRRHAPSGQLLLDQLGHDVRDLWRSRIVLVFTFLFPMTWLVVLGLVMAGDTVDEATGLPIMQFLTPTAAAMGILFAAYPTVATALATAREDGILKRVHGTPLPTWVFLGGRVGAAVLFAFTSFAAMLTVGTVFYDVDLIGRTALATVVTTVVATASFAAVGLAVATLATSAATAQAASIASTVAIAFLSGLMGFGDMPVWADRVASFFPVKPFNDALREQFNPYGAGSGWDLDALAVIAAWGIAAALVAARAFRWDPAMKRQRRRDGVRAATALWTAVCTGVLLVVEGLLLFDLDIAPSGLPAAAALLLLGTASITACGFVLVSLVPSRTAASAVGLGILFPVSFISNVFVAGDMPGWLDAVGSLLPLKHLAGSLVAALDPAGPSVSWTSVTVMAAWLVLAALVAVRLFTWEPRR